MERLREQQGTEPVARRAAELLQAARPLEASPAAEERVRTRLLTADGGGRRRGPRLLFGAGALLAAAAAAAAVSYLGAERPAREGSPGVGALTAPRTLGLSPAPAPLSAAAPSAVASSAPLAPSAAPLVERGGAPPARPEAASAAPSRRRPSPRPRLSAPVAARRSRAAASAVGSPAAVSLAMTSALGPSPESPASPASPASQPPVPVPVARETPSEARQAEAPLRAGPAVAGTDAPAPAALGRDEEAALLLRAVRALRADADPARGAALLDELLRRFPRGAMAEEALGLAIEAASSLGQGRVRSLARDYLRRFPDGRSAALAGRVLASP